MCGWNFLLQAASQEGFGGRVLAPVDLRIDTVILAAVAVLVSYLLVVARGTGRVPGIAEFLNSQRHQQTS